MRKIAVVMAILLTGAFVVQAQNFIVVDTEKIFKSLQEYNNALEEVDKLGEKYQENVDEAFAKVEKMYEEYQQQRMRLSETARREREDVIIENEKRINEYQQKIFGQGGELMQKRIELIKPIQDRVFEAINKFAENNNFDMVLDISSNPAIIYHSPKADKTNDIIRLVGGKPESEGNKVEDIKILN